MGIGSQFSAQCPVCNTDITFYRVKRRFNCPKCATTLGSNRSTVDVWAALIYVLLVPVVWWFVYDRNSHADATLYVEWTILTAAVAIGAYCLLAPRLLWLETDSWTRDAPPMPVGKKRKVLTYRETPGPNEVSGQKRAS